MPYPDTPGHVPGSETSLAAAVKLDPASLRFLVLSAIKANTNEFTQGMTDEELDRHYKPANCRTLRPRRCELKAMGLIYDSGYRRPSTHGRMMVVWKAVYAK